jgi:hypothetical protein
LIFLEDIMQKTPVFFNLAKWISLLVATLALLGCVFALFGVLKSFGPGRFDAPEFGDESVQKLILSHAVIDDAQTQQDKLNVTNKYGQRILSIITRHKIAKLKVDDMIGWLLEDVPEERRDGFVSGLDNFLADGMTFMQGKGRANEETGVELVLLYRAQFDKALRAVERDKSAAEQKREASIGVAVMLALLFVVAMVVPVLVRIEQNTRSGSLTTLPANPTTPAPVIVSATASPPAAPSVAAAVSGSACPTCGTTVGVGDVFCGECGALLK